jgi:hypothetical protein
LPVPLLGFPLPVLVFFCCAMMARVRDYVLLQRDRDTAMVTTEQSPGISLPSKQPTYTQGAASNLS